MKQVHFFFSWVLFVCLILGPLSFGSALIWGVPLYGIEAGVALVVLLLLFSDRLILRMHRIDTKLPLGFEQTLRRLKKKAGGGTRFATVFFDLGVSPKLIVGRSLLRPNGFILISRGLHSQLNQAELEKLLAYSFRASRRTRLFLASASAVLLGAMFKVLGKSWLPALLKGGESPSQWKHRRLSVRSILLFLACYPWMRCLAYVGRLDLELPQELRMMASTKFQVRWRVDLSPALASLYLYPPMRIQESLIGPL